ncbi:alpha/beta-hydrolase [Backusella circina FSU 941]|nr:alpha/beta-hydrolase [Backusella circina FSU 941]
MRDKYNPSSYHHYYATVNGIRMHYVDENTTSSRVLLLLHGWPDLWIGWREQIFLLAKLGYRVVVPTLRGFGETEAPEHSSEYGIGTIATDLAHLLDHLAVPTVAVIGHDWGGFAAWRFSQFYSNRVSAVASFCTPYTPPAPIPMTLEDVVALLPNFEYQLYLRTSDAEREISSDLSKFFCRLFQPVDDTDPPIVDPKTKKIVQGRRDLARSRLLPLKILEYYIEQYKRPGAVRGSLCWYKQTENNYEECKDLDVNISHPALVVLAERDISLPLAMAEDMRDYVEQLEMVTVKGAGHWILWENPDKCNEVLVKWLEKVFPAHQNSKL